jgi:hypothetical protein
MNTSPAGFSGYSGILVITYEVPDDESDPFAWTANNGPLQHLFPEECGDAAIKQRLEALWQQTTSTEEVPRPPDSDPRFVQSYCIYRGPGDVRPVARYTDLLNSDGIPIPRYRMANVRVYDFGVCRFTLHALFRPNEARLAGIKFSATLQLGTCEPLDLLPNEKSPRWVWFHPSRVLRTRPTVRAIPTPDNLVNGVMSTETAQKIMQIRRLEANLHTLAFGLDARPRSAINNGGDACMATFSHWARSGHCIRIEAHTQA